MIKIKHPTLSATKFVKESAVDSWVKAGWLRVPAQDAAKPSPAPGRKAE